jgi:hypothetical protein
MDEIVHQLRAEAERSGNIFSGKPRYNCALSTSDLEFYLHDDPRIAFIDIDMHATRRPTNNSATWQRSARSTWRLMPKRL